MVVEFNAGIEVSEAKQKVKDAVDKTKNDLPYGETRIYLSSFSYILQHNPRISLMDF